MSESELASYTIEFAIAVVEYYKWLTNVKKEHVMSKQMLRSGTSIGANVHEAKYAASKADFVAKMQIALKETSETEYWMIVLSQTGYGSESTAKMEKHLVSIKKMLIATINTVKREN